MSTMDLLINWTQWCLMSPRSREMPCSRVATAWVCGYWRSNSVPFEATAHTIIQPRNSRDTKIKKSLAWLLKISHTFYFQVIIENSLIRYFIQSRLRKVSQVHKIETGNLIVYHVFIDTELYMETLINNNANHKKQSQLYE